MIKHSKKSKKTIHYQYIIKMSAIMLQKDLIATPKALWIKVFHDRMILMGHDGSTIATEYTENQQIQFDSTQITQHFTDAAQSLDKLLNQIQLPWYQKPPIIFLQILEPITPNLPALIRQAYLELGYEHARLIRLYNETGESLDLSPLKTINKHLYYILLLSIIFLGLCVIFYQHFFSIKPQ